MRALVIKALRRLLHSSLSREPSRGSKKSVCLKDFLIASDFTDFIALPTTDFIALPNNYYTFFE